MKEQKSVKLYNMIFPIWLLILFPLTWLIVIPANFLIDSLIVYFTMKKLSVEEPKQKFKKVILKVVCFGFVADIIGGFFMFLPNFIDYSVFTENTRLIYSNFVNAIMYNPFRSVYGLVWVFLCMLISSSAIYFLNFKFSFTKVDIERAVKMRISLLLAICTTPVLFLLPTQWFY